MDGLDALGSAFTHKEPGRRKKIDKQRKLRSSLLGPADGAEAGGRSEFSSFLNGPAAEEAVEELLDEVNESGERLHESQSLENIKAFRDAVKRFLGHVMKNALDVVEHASAAGIRNRKKFTLVEVIDRKLESLAAAVLAGQADQMETLRRIDEIRGLLVDLLT